MQFLRDIKSCAEFLKYRSRYPGCRCSFGSRISGNTALGNNVRIGSDARVTDSKIEEGAFVAERTSVARATLGKYVGIHRDNQLADVVVGAYSYVADRGFLSNAVIGKFCSIGPDIMCGYGVHPMSWPSTSPVFYSTAGQTGRSFADQTCFDEKRVTSIGNDVWIGARVFVKDGVTVGDGAVIAAGAVVTNDISPYSIVGGVPAKLIRNRYDETRISRLLKLQWWHWPDEVLATRQALFSQEDLDELFSFGEQMNPEPQSTRA